MLNAGLEGDIEDAEKVARFAVIDNQLSRLPSPIPGGVVFAGEQLSTFGDLWELLTTDERRDACRTVFERVAVDTRCHEVFFKPWPEFDPYLKARRVVCLVGPPGFEPRTNRL